MASLRPQTVAPDQSRPLTRDPFRKKPSLLQRLTPQRGGSCSTFSSSMTTALLQRKASSSRSRRNRRTTSALSSSNMMHLLENVCHRDLLPRILAFAGPQATAALERTNLFWYNLIQEETTWKVLCEELYKWKAGEEQPKSWRDFYRFNPCVPVDYSSVNTALSIAKTPQVEQSRSIRVLLRPGRYILREGITVHAPTDARVVIETMEMPNSFNPIIETPVETEPVKRRKRSSSFRNILHCRTAEVEDPNEEQFPAEFLDPVSTAGAVPSTRRATLTLRTRKQNEPIIRVSQGSCFLRNLDLRHISHGTDIWNGNAALQIQPPNGPDGQPLMMLTPPTAVLDHVEVSSVSGRGIVNIDGGNVVIKNCYVHDCAATGVYVGGPGSRARIERTDVVRNGNGNTRHRRGIARGHSGIYLEQGHAHIKDCNVSQNSLTGISAVSSENAILNLEESDLVANGTFQLEMPAVGTNARRQSFTTNNNFSVTGFARSRSGLVSED